MRWMRNASTTTKLVLGFVPLSILIGVIGWIGSTNMGIINDNVENLYKTQLVPSLDLAKVRGLIHQQRALVYRALSLSDPEKIKETVQQVRDMEREIGELQKRIEGSIQVPKVQGAYDRFKEAERRYADFREKKILLPLEQGRVDEAAQAAHGEGAAYFDPAIETLNQTLDVKQEVSKGKYEESQNIFTTSRTGFVVIVVLGVLFGLALGRSISMIIVRPLHRTMGVLEAVAGGDLNQRVEVDSKDEVGRMASALNVAIEALRNAAERERKQVEWERRLASTVAHELRNPLNVVKTSVYFLLNARAPSAEKKAEHLQRIERHVVAADCVITALSNFARMPVPNLRPISVESCLREVVEMNPLPANVQAVIDCPSTLPQVLGDIDQLRIVFGNLVRNAAEAMPQGGRLSLIGRRLDDGAVEVDVADTGVGITPDHLGKIMEPLFSTKTRGLGLGLAMARAIVNKNKGEIRVASELGKGSTFTVRLTAAV